MPFYIGDWRKDPGVQSLDFFHRGLWFEILCLMYESEQRGKLLLNGKPMPVEALSRLLGLDKQSLTKALTLLLETGVASRCGTTGILLSRRMVKDEELRKVRAECGKKGGNPALKLVKQKPNQNTEDEVETVIESFCNREGIGEGMRKNGFPDAWRDWRAYRAEKGEALTSYTAAGSMAKCVRWGSKKATEIIRNAIERSWKNLIAPEEVNPGFGTGPMREAKLVISKPAKPTDLMLQVGDAKLFLSDPTNLSADEQNACKAFLRTLAPISYPAYFNDSEQLKIQEYVK